MALEGRTMKVIDVQELGQSAVGQSAVESAPGTRSSCAGDGVVMSQTVVGSVPAYLGADGGAAELVGMLDGCEVWVVRRWTRPRVAGVAPTAYWTAVMQTVPGREKSMSYISHKYAEIEYGATGARCLAVLRTREALDYHASVAAMA
jgi:hypothetical protein